jgi:hypothetical protein
LFRNFKEWFSKEFPFEVFRLFEYFVDPSDPRGKR